MLSAIAIAYLTVPAVFYLSDALTKLIDPVGMHVLVAQPVLLCTGVGSFAILIRRSRNVALHPVASAAAASVGLVHWFGLYMVLGSRWVWHSVADVKLGDTLALLLLNLVLPIVTLSGSAYDGTMLTLPAVWIGLFLSAFNQVRSARPLANQRMERTG